MDFCSFHYYEKRFAEFYDSSDTKITGEFFKYIPQNPLFLFTMNFNGEKILSMFDKFGVTSLIDDLIKEPADEDVKFDYKALISSINGDIMMSFYNANIANTTEISFFIFEGLQA